MSWQDGAIRYAYSKPDAARKPGVFTGWLWLSALLVICLAAWAGAGVILWLVYP